MYQIFEKLCELKGITPYRVCKETGLTTATISNWKAGRYTPKQDKLQKIADYFGVSIEYLMTGVQTIHSDINDKIAVNPKTQKDIINILSDTEQMLKQDGLMFDGKPASQEAIDSVLSAMRIGMEMAKEKNKEKYTPKKYKKD